MTTTTDRLTVAWLIELNASIPTYWDGRGNETFHYNHNEAIRFARQEDAERVLLWIIHAKLRAECKVVEHAWREVREDHETR